MHHELSGPLFSNKISNLPATIDPQKHSLSLADLHLPLFAILICDGRILEWNKALEETTGRTLAQLRHVSFESVVTSKQNLQEEVLDQGLKQPLHCDISILSAINGRLVSFSATVLRHSSEDGEAAVFMLERTKESGISNPAQSCRDCNLGVRDFPTPTFCVSETESVTRWNSWMEQLTGFSAEDALGKSIKTLLNTKAEVGGTEQLSFAEIQDHSGKAIHVSFKSSLLNTNETLVVVHEVMAHVQEAERWGKLIQHMKSPICSTDAKGRIQILDVATSPNAICEVDKQLRVRQWNERMAKVTGFSADEAVQTPFLETCVAVEQQEEVDAILERALMGRGASSVELRLKTKRGEVRNLDVTISARRDAENRILGVVLFTLDDTEPSKHGKTVSSMASELRLLIDTANAPIFGIDSEGDINEWNEKTAEITGYTKEEAFDCSLIQTFIVPSMQTAVQNVFENALQGRPASNLEVQFRTKSNEIRHLLLNATTRRDADRNIVGAVGVAQDVSESVQRDRVVAGMALELRQLIDTANAPIFGIDRDGNVNEWNWRAKEITGYSKEETWDEPLVERFIAPSMRETVRKILDSALQGIETSNYEVEFVTKSGESRFLLVNATTRRDSDYNVVGVVGVAQDVTEDRRQAAELQKMHNLQAAQEAKVETERNMTAYFAHELRNPLGAIDSALNAMPEDLPEGAKSLVSGMQLCSSFMSSIMNNLLDVRKMEEGKMELNKSPLSLRKMLVGVHKMLLPSVKNGVKFECVAHTEGRDWVLGDEHRIQQVLTNVVTNALKYTLKGSVRISLSWDESHTVFECADTGPGIPKSEQEKLFERFVQRGGAPGTGLGLAIAKHLVDLNNGEIKFISDPSIRAGTKCIVRLPMDLCDEPEKNRAKGGATRELEAGTGLLQEPLRVFIVDDIQMNRKMFKRRIQKGIAPNCIISEASTGEEALQVCGTESFDVIIIDQFMGDAGGVMLGTDVVYAMRRMRIDSIVIGCSGNDLNQEFIEAGADLVWQKPMPTNEKIISNLRDLLGKRKK